jgi:hypothetical protein
MKWPTISVPRSVLHPMLGENARGGVGVPNTPLAIADSHHPQSGWLLRFFYFFVEKSVLSKNLQRNY